MSSTMADLSLPVAIDTGGQLRAMAFSANSDYIVSGHDQEIRVWRTEDGKRVATMKAGVVNCLTVSKDNKWIAAGTYPSGIFVWDARTYRQVLVNRQGYYNILGVDFSPNLKKTRLVAASDNRTATVWAVTIRKQAQILHHEHAVTAAKYSPQGDHIATATPNCVRVWDAKDGRLLTEINVDVTPRYNTGLLWFGDQILVLSDIAVKEFDALSGSAVAEHPVPEINYNSCLALPNHCGFTALSSNRAIAFWDISRHNQLALIQHPQAIRSIAFSGHRLLAIGEEDGRVNIKSIIDFIPLAHLQPEFDIKTDDTTLELWKNDQLEEAEALLTATIRKSRNPKHHVLANRALIRARLRRWDAALVDAEVAINIQPSAIGYIAKGVALVGKGEREKGYQACDMAYGLYPSYLSADFLLLIKAVIMFNAGEHRDAISRVGDLIPTAHFNPECYMVQAHMHFLFGDVQMECGDFEGAIQSFECARARMRHYPSRLLLVISLISGWDFGILDITIRQHLCEALYTVGRTKGAGQYLLQMVNALDKQIYTNQLVIKWVADFTRKCLSGRGVALNTTRIADPRILHATLNKRISTSLLREWARATLNSDQWKDALFTASDFMLPRATIYRVVCERLEEINHVTDAVECFHEMVGELGGQIYKSGLVEWVCDFAQRRLSESESGHDMLAFHTAFSAPLLVVWAKAKLMSGTWQDALTASASFMLPRIAIYRVLCENLETTNHVPDMVECFHEMIRASEGEIYSNETVLEWVCDFAQLCLSAPKSHALSDANQDTSAPPLSTILPSLLREWAKVKLIRGPWKDALHSADGFTLPRVEIYWVICERLEVTGQITDAAECFHGMEGELEAEPKPHGKHPEWSLQVAFRQRLFEKLEHLGDAAVDAQLYDEATSHYSAALFLLSSSPEAILIKRSKAWLATGSWKDALDDANQVIMLDLSSPWGYEMKHAALRMAGDYNNAVDALETMLSKMANSPDPVVQQRSDQYISPSSTRMAIRKIVQQTIRHSPRVLINVTSGRLYSKAEQASAFELSSIFNDLVSSMKSRIDYVRIKWEVRQYFRYAMLSHKWENNEPLYHQVIHIAVYDLEKSPTHDKLQTFCAIVRDAGFNWAWSDTCCIDKSNHFVLQEALVAMFKWYQGSVITIVFLRGVRASSRRGALARSIWNTRAWTLQEYVASRVIHFYTEDWTPYLNLQSSNHKESPEIVWEMEQATSVSAQQLMSLRPGLASIREKLRLASARETTLVEDAAYSLLGILSVTGIPAIYGEGDGSLGRLLAHVLTVSGDASILAWTGESGSFNSCLPSRIPVYRAQASSHLPPPIADDRPDRVIAASRYSPYLSMALRLYDCLNDLPAPWFAASRMKLPCIAFRLPPLIPHRTRSVRVYRADTTTFGMVEIRTRHDLSRMNSLYIVHPWLDTLMGREEVHGDSPIEEDATPPPSPDTDDETISIDQIDDNASLLSEPESQSRPSLPCTVPMTRETRARRLVSRLKQPFGALLLTPVSTGGRAVDYRRVAADSLITVQLQDNVLLADILDSVRTFDIL